MLNNSENQTMKRLALGLAAACVAGGFALAQTSTPGANGAAGAGGSTATSTGTGTGMGTAGTGAGGTAAGNTGGTSTGIGNAVNNARTSVGNAVGKVLPSQNGQAAASGDNNQAVATTDANSAQPAHGSNSFTAAQARGRIQDKGFANVTDLKKDNGGVWRGKAEKNGQTVSVWLDYKGNVGQ